MEDPAYTTLAPRSLVMTRSACFYCGAPDTGWEEIEYLFGLKCCSLHETAAFRDCRAYLHEKKMVMFDDAYKHPILGAFLQMLKGVSFPVLRSSGELQTGWTLNDNTFTKDTFILYDTSVGDWVVPVRREVEGQDIITKYTPIYNLKMADMFDTSLIDETVFCLIDGVYTKEYEEVWALRQGGDSSRFPDIPGVVEVMYNGQIRRVINPRGGGAAAAAAAAPIPDITENPS